MSNVCLTFIKIKKEKQNRHPQTIYLKQMQSQNFNFDDRKFQHSDPLEYLDDQLCRKPRSSLDSHDRAREIPMCDPPFIPYHRDSGRSRRHHVEAYSPQLSPCRPHQPVQLGFFMQADTFEEDVDFLYPSPRERCGSDTNFSSSNMMPMSSDSLTLN